MSRAHSGWLCTAAGLPAALHQGRGDAPQEGAASGEDVPVVQLARDRMPCRHALAHLRRQTMSG